MKDLKFEDVVGIDKVENVWRNTPNQFVSKEDFVRFFDDSENFDRVIQMGFIDFAHKIFTPEFYGLIGDPRSKTSLEIGFGGGRLINVASRFFGKSIGVDIHNDFDRTLNILGDLKSGNCELIRSENIKDVGDNSIDFVYSFIVFQHFDTWKTAENYLEQIERVLSPEGAGIIYFGINRHNSQDYIESNGTLAEKKACTLQVNPEFAIREMQKRFLVFEASEGPKRPWDMRQSSQFYIKFANKNHPKVTINSENS
jgi:ubiquinone/menaquinone biosynthesis C-methylase UbiE